MIKLVVQKIRECTGCGDVLSQKCDKCKKCPSRKPRVTEVYDWPPILETAACGCCVKVACQIPDELRPGSCKKTSWKRVLNSAGATSAHLFCSHPCANIATAAARKNRVTIKCAWCGTPKEIHAYRLARTKMLFCRKSCRFMHQRQEAANRKKANAKIDSGRMLLECRGRCRSITEHMKSRRGAYCLTCSTTRADGIFVAAALSNKPNGNAFNGARA